MTTDEVAAYLRVDVVTVRRLVARGDLAAYRIGGEYRFTQDDLLAYLRRQYVPLRAAPMSTGRDAPTGVPSLLLARDMERLTPLWTRRARRSLALAHEEAQNGGQGYLGTQHLLLGLLCEQAGMAARVLAEVGITASAARTALVAATEWPERADSLAPAGELAATDAVRGALHQALAQGAAWEHRHIGTEHMLCGLVRVEGANSTLLLELLGTAPDMVEAEILRLVHAAGGKQP